MVNERVVATISQLLRNVPLMMGETETLRFIRAADALPGMASFMVPDPTKNISLVKFHRDLKIDDFDEFERAYRGQYTCFQGKFILIFDL